MRLLATIVATLALVGVAFSQNPVVSQSTLIEIRSSATNYPYLRAISPGPQNVPWIQFGTQTNTIFEINASGILDVAYGGTGTNSLAGLVSGLSAGLVASTNGSATNINIYGGYVTNTTGSGNTETNLTVLGGYITNTTGSGNIQTNLVVIGATVTNAALFTPTANSVIVTNGITNTSLTASQTVWTDANKMLITRNAATTVTALGFQTNQVVTTADGTVTNTFASAYPAPPVVLITQFGTVNSPTNIVVSVTATEAVINCGKAGVTNNVLAIRPP